MSMRIIFIVAMTIGSFVWMGCEPAKPRGRTNTGTGQYNQSPQAQRARSLPREQKRRIAIEDFEVKAQDVNIPGKNSQTVSQIASALTDKFENYIVNSQCFRVVTNRTSGDRDAAIREVDETSSDYYNQDTAVDFGEQLGPELQMRGSVIAINVTDHGALGGGNENFGVVLHSVTYEVRLSCRIFDNATGEILYAAEGIAEKTDSSLGAVGGESKWIVGGKFAENTPLQELVDVAVDELVNEIIERVY